ncbi:hypothetical protein [Paenibacillus methanolicus]|uniref:Uncharacterized protein n=1 Tax=Paenibacillus methanolicus TaxID=582686 RepID=A0A5S5C591_9BACL|nr:hypothetical protein [Paenibacillus methanolicus]TYP74504.1 hypothetical protein BCM02_10548 [Paenibacillus methanolicus]
MPWLRKHVWKIAIGAVIVLGLVSFLSPELAIRRYMLLHLHPIDCWTAGITNMEREDRVYGHLYDVRGFTDRATGGEMGVFYLKQTGPFWYVGSVGTGP